MDDINSIKKSSQTLSETEDIVLKSLLTIESISVNAFNENHSDGVGYNFADYRADETVEIKNSFKGKNLKTKFVGHDFRIGSTIESIDSMVVFNGIVRYDGVYRIELISNDSILEDIDVFYILDKYIKTLIVEGVINLTSLRNLNCSNPATHALIQNTVNQMKPWTDNLSILSRLSIKIAEKFMQRK